MIIRVTGSRSGLSKYLRDGKKQGCDLSRDERDQVIPLIGNLKAFEKAEKFTMKHKKWKENYEHITVGFSANDMQKLDSLADSERYEKLQEIVNQVVNHRTSGYSKEHEIIAYAELHNPKTKIENGQERFAHIHIGLSRLNKLDETQIRTPFFSDNGLFIERTFSDYMCEMHELDNPRKVSNREENRKKPFSLPISSTRKDVVNLLSHIETAEELQAELKSNNHNYRIVKGASYDYVKLRMEKSQINIRGRGFERFEIPKSGAEKTNKSRVDNQQERLAVLDNFYQYRKAEIQKRRSKKNLKLISEAEHPKRSKHNGLALFDANLNDKYNKKISVNGAFVYTNDNALTVRNIPDNMSVNEQARIAVTIAQKNNWRPGELKIIGNDDFQVSAFNELQNWRSSTRRKEQKTTISKPTKIGRSESVLDHLIQKSIDTVRLKSRELMDHLKSVPAQAVIDYAAKWFEVDGSRLSVVDNKIKFDGDRKKPQTNIDFLTKRVNLSLDETVDILDTLSNDPNNVREMAKIQREKHNSMIDNLIAKNPNMVTTLQNRSENGEALSKPHIEILRRFDEIHKFSEPEPLEESAEEVDEDIKDDIDDEQQQYRGNTM